MRYGRGLVGMLFVLGGVLQAAQGDGGAPGPGAGRGPDDGGPNPRRGPGQIDPQQRQRMMDQLKDKLGASDDDWKTLQPKIEALQKLTMESRLSAAGPWMRRRPGANQDPNQAKTEIQQKTEELQALTDDKDSDPQAVKAKLQELRDARDKLKKNLKAAQDELRGQLTAQQEAQLVLMGILD